MSWVLVTISRVEGSGPREVGAWMAVSSAELRGTVGGGHLEFDAIARARAALAGESLDEEVRYPLGPSLGQCCGGVVWLRFERMPEPPPEPRVPVALFGGGHVGQALARVLLALGFDLHWIDSREGVFPAGIAARLEHADPVQDAVPDVAPGSHVVIMSFSHAEDLDVLAAVLLRQRQRGDLPFIGLIGSRTKWARFWHRLEERGFSDAELAQVHCPIGWPGLPGKRPEQIAVAIAAQLLAAPRLARDVLAPRPPSP